MTEGSQAGEKPTKRSRRRTILIILGVIIIGCCGLSALAALLGGGDDTTVETTPVVEVAPSAEQPVASAPTNTSTPTDTPIPAPTDTPIPVSPTDTPQPTETPAPPTNTPTPTGVPPITETLSDGLGISRTQWEQHHSHGGVGPFPDVYDDGRYWVLYDGDQIQYLEIRLSDQPGIETARRIASLSIPRDAELIETYSPADVPELTVDRYFSSWLASQFKAEWVWSGSEPGTFIVIYGVFDGRVPSAIIATGNNP